MNTLALVDDSLETADEPVYVVVGDPAKWRRMSEQEAATKARLMGEDAPDELREAAGLAPRPLRSAPAWDYHAAAARYAASGGMCY